LGGFGNQTATTTVGSNGSWTISFPQPLSVIGDLSASATSPYGEEVIEVAPSGQKTFTNLHVTTASGPPLTINGLDSVVTTISGEAEVGSSIRRSTGSATLATATVGAKGAWSLALPSSSAFFGSTVTLTETSPTGVITAEGARIYSQFGEIYLAQDGAAEGSV